MWGLFKKEVKSPPNLQDKKNAEKSLLDQQAAIENILKSNAKAATDNYAERIKSLEDSIEKLKTDKPNINFRSELDALKKEHQANLEKFRRKRSNTK